MEYGLNDVKMKSSSDIFQNYYIIIRSLYKKYCPDMSLDDYNNIVNNIIDDSRKNYKGNFPYSRYLKNKITSMLIKYNSDHFNIDIFIDNNFLNINDINDALSKMSSLKKYLSSNSIEIKIDYIINLLKNNSTFNNTVKFIFDDHYKKQQVDSKKRYFISDNFVNLCVECYCLINDIDLFSSNEEGESIDDVFEDLDSTGLYFKSISSGKVMSADEEKELFLKVKSGDKAAKELFIKNNLKLVVSIAKNYRGRGLPLLDLVQEGNVGLLMAVDKFDVSLGFKFSTHACWWIRQAITRSLNTYARSIRLPNYLIEYVNKYKVIYNRLMSLNNTEPSDEQIALEMGISVDKVLKLKKYLNDTISLNSIVEDSYSNAKNNRIEVEDFISSHEDSIEDSYIHSQVTGYVRDWLSKVNASQRNLDIVYYRFGLYGDEPKTLDELSSMFGITRERARQIVIETLSIMRNSREADNFLIFADNPHEADEFIKYWRSNCRSKDTRYKTYKKR